MNNPLGTLTDDEVRQIALLVETLDQSTFDFLQLELGDLKVTIGKGNVPPGGGAAPAMPAPSQIAAPASPAAAHAAAGVTAPATVPIPPAQAAPADSAAQDGTVAIVAPMMGRFYAKPEPGAAPFISVGTEVNPDTTAALIEVMKVFTAVRAGVHGVVTEICVQNEQYIEYGQILFRVRPAQTDSNPDTARTKGSRKGSRS